MNKIKIDKRLDYICKFKFLTKNSNTVYGYCYKISEDIMFNYFKPFIEIYKEYKNDFYFYKVKEKKNKYKSLSKIDGKSLYCDINIFIVFKKEDLVNDRPIYLRKN